MDAAIAAANYIALVTFRRDGTAVSTPVWFVVDADRILVWTDATSGKVKRIRANPSVTIAVCDVRGRPRSSVLTGTARVLDDDVAATVHRLLRTKHRVLKPLIAAWRWLGQKLSRRTRPAAAYVEITLDPPK